MDSSQRMAQSQRDQQTADYKPEQRKSPESNSQKQYSQPKVRDGCARMPVLLLERPSGFVMGRVMACAEVLARYMAGSRLID